MSTTPTIILKDCESILKMVDLRSLKGKRVLVTGASGFIGQYIVSALYVANEKYKLGCRVECVSRTGSGPVIRPYLASPLVTFRKIDLTKPFKLTEKYDYIFHAAGYGQPAKFVADPASTISINIDATKTLLEVAERSKGTFVLFSSTEVYGHMPKGMKSFSESYTGAPSVEGPRAVYAGAKRLAESLALFYQQRGVRVRIVRISAVYGPGALPTDARVMSDFIRKALETKVIALLDQGSSVRTYGYLADVTAMILHAAIKGKETIYNVGGKDVMSIRELAERIAKETKAIVQIPHTASKKYFVGNDPNFVKLNLTRIRNDMPRLSFTPFSRGLKNTISWAKN